LAWLGLAWLGLAWLGLNAPLVCALAFDEVHHDFAKECEVFGTVVRPDARLVFAERHIEAPMKLVFDAPVCANHFAEVSGIYGVAAPVITTFDRGFGSADGSLTLDHDDAAQTLPLLQIGEPIELLGGPNAAHFESTVFATIHGLVERVRDFFESLRASIDEVLFNAIMRGFLIPFESHNVIATLVNHLFGNGSLASHRVDCDGCPTNIE
jgi:hypothetical protein